MITQELRDYVQAQQAAGVSREEIIAVLLEQGGWTKEQVEEAFSAGASGVPTAPQPASGAEMTHPPKSIKRFEWLMYGSVGGSVLVLVAQAVSFGYDLGTVLLGAIVPLLGWMLRLGFVYMVVYRRVEWARIALAVLFGFGLLGTSTLLLVVFSNPLFLLAIIPVALEAVAVYYVFTADSSAWLDDPASLVQTPAAGHSDGVIPAATAEAGRTNVYWSKWIPAVNGLFMFGVLGMMLVVNMIILLTDSLNLGLETMAFFYAIMFIPTGIFVAFYFYEQRTLVSRYQHSHSRLDPWLLLLIILRNSAFVASVIPFVQVLGMAALILGGVPYLIAYYVMLRARNRAVAAV